MIRRFFPSLLIRFQKRTIKTNTGEPSVIDVEDTDALRLLQSVGALVNAVQKGERWTPDKKPYVKCVEAWLEKANTPHGFVITHIFGGPDADFLDNDPNLPETPFARVVRDLLNSNPNVHLLTPKSWGEHSVVRLRCNVPSQPNAHERIQWKRHMFTNTCVNIVHKHLNIEIVEAA